MFLPVGDSPNPKGTPWVTWTLIALNVAVYLALLPLAFEPADPRTPEVQAYLEALVDERGAAPTAMSRGDVVRFEWGAKPKDLAAGPSAWITVFTAMFLHGGLLHLLGNMLFLWIFGDNVEHRLGRVGFLLAYLLTGVLATGGDAILRWGSSIPAVGASGAISGVLGLYFVLFPHNRVRIYFFFLPPFFFSLGEIQARFVLGAYLILNNVLPLLLTMGSGGVSYGAHIGGFLAGWWLARQIAAERPLQPPERESAAAGPSLHSRFRDALWTGRLDDAAAYLFDLPKSVSRRALTAADKVALGDALVGAGRARTALAAYQRALADHPNARERVAAHLGAARLLLAAYRLPTAAYQHVYAAMEADPTPAEEAAARDLLEELRTGVRTLPRTSWSP
ncbi:MAG: rhomboid family intramembrane serine protease [Acidobacteriota bacterium]